MRCALVALLVFAAACHGQNGKKNSKRYGYEYEPKLYRQDSPQEALKSIVKALNQKKLDYMMAHLVDPEFVDDEVEQVKRLFGKKSNPKAVTFVAFERVVKQTQLHFLEDPQVLKELRMFAKSDMWEFKPKGDLAIVSHKAIPARRVFMRNIGGRWFLMNKQK